MSVLIVLGLLVIWLQGKRVRRLQHQLLLERLEHAEDKLLAQELIERNCVETQAFIDSLQADDTFTFSMN